MSNIKVTFNLWERSWRRTISFIFCNLAAVGGMYVVDTFVWVKVKQLPDAILVDQRNRFIAFMIHGCFMFNMPAITIAEGEREEV